MADYNLRGRWLQGNLEINISMTGPDGEFKVEAVSAELKKYWLAGSGEVFQSGKFHLTLNPPDGDDVEFQGYISADAKTMNLNNGVVWTRK